MTKRLLDYDPFTGMTTWHRYDETEDRTILEYEQDCQQILDRNKAAEAEFSRTSGTGDGFHAASIPSSIMLKWLVEYGVDVMNKDHMPAVKRLLNSSEWKHLKRVPFTL